ncbi:MAG: DNA mismatch repair endonuclease MutL [Bacillota bacterium]
MANIKKLSEQIANQISAGEVVERPASVVKELIENSLDADADEIEITITDGGKELIKVKDNGRGIRRDEVELAFSRYATSKIEEIDDLYSLGTLGFRGEALASIAAVSKMTAKTSYQDEEKGTKLVLHGGTVQTRETIGFARGLEITVEDLFYNTPARHKYLKKTTTEAARVSRIVTAAALSRPDVKFTLKHNDHTTINTPGNGQLKAAVYSIYGDEIYEQLIPVEFKENFISVTGYLVKPQALRSSRQHQFYFVNKRPVYNKYLRLAVEEAYREMYGIKKYPIVFLNIDLNPILVDVNVHPTKREIKFSRGKDIKRTIKSNIKDILQQNGKPTYHSYTGKGKHHDKLDYTRKSRPKSEQHKPVEYLPSRLDLTGNMIKEDSRSDRPGPQGPQANITDRTPERSDAQSQGQGSKQVQESSPAERRTVIGQLHNLFIVVESEDGLLLVDQHNAHERIIFEELKEKIDTKTNPSRMLLTPISLNLTAQEKEILLEIRSELEKIGFEIEEFGPASYALAAVPFFLPENAPEENVLDIINHLLETTNMTEKSELVDEALKYNSCRKAIKEGKRLEHQEMAVIITRLFETSNPYYCPHYRPIILDYSLDELKQQVERYE